MNPADSWKAANRALAEKLHSGPLQVVTGLRLRLAACAEKGVADADDLVELSVYAADLQNELNRIIRHLTDPLDDDSVSGGSDPDVTFDLCDRLRRLCADFRQRCDVSCDLLVIPAHTRLPSIAGVIVYRAIRELLDNVRKHSDARNVEVASSIRDDGSVVFSISDDGVGLAGEGVSSLNESGFGLWSISQRLHEIGASLESDSDGGLIVQIVLPPKMLASAGQIRLA